MGGLPTHDFLKMLEKVSTYQKGKTENADEAKRGRIDFRGYFSGLVKNIPNILHIDCESDDFGALALIAAAASATDRPWPRVIAHLATHDKTKEVKQGLKNNDVLLKDPNGYEVTSNRIQQMLQNYDETSAELRFRHGYVRARSSEVIEEKTESSDNYGLVNKFFMTINR